MESFTSILIATGVLLVFVAIWYGATVLLTPHMDNPDGYAKVTGNCGDTMEIGLKLKDGIVDNTHSWTDGCSMSKLCVESAVRLARNKDISSLQQINMMMIIDELGSLPDTHLHCAQLAETTLQKAVDNYMEKVA